MKQNETKLSLIVPVYNVEKYLRDCLDSLLNQTCKDFEVICVNDASTDSSGEILKEYKYKFNQIKIINKTKNEGVGFARNTGLQSVNSKHVVFLDSDDYIEENTIEKIIEIIDFTDPDILMFGTKLLHETQVRSSKEEIDWYKLKYSGVKEFSPYMLLNINVELWNKVFKTSIIMENNICFPKNKFEDVVFLFKYALQCKNVYFINKNLYVYRQRDNSMMSKTLKGDKNWLIQGILCCREIFAYYLKNNATQEFNIVLIRLFIRNFFFANAYIARNDFDEFYNTSLVVWHQIYSSGLDVKKHLTAEEIQQIDDITNNKKKIFNYRFNDSNIKILLAYHKPNHLLSSEVFIPIHAGSAIKNTSSKDGALNDQSALWLKKYTKGDNSGDNISDKNRFYAELTVQYWAWKNQEKINNPDYIGFMHYRRHFIFKNYSSYSRELPCATFDYINEQYLKTIGLQDRYLSDIVSKYDCVVYRPFREPFNVYEQFSDLEDSKWNLDKKIFDKVILKTQELYPNYNEALFEYLNSNEHYWYNMFIFKKEIFNTYMEWLFDILFATEKEIDLSTYSIEGQRVLAHIAERLLGVFIKHISRENKKIKILELPVAFVEKPEIGFPLNPTFNANNISIVFATDNYYADYLIVTIQSLIDNVTSIYNYDIYILDDKIDDFKKNTISKLIKDFDNINITFIDINLYLSDDIKKLFYVNNQFTMATYYRFFIEILFKNFDKVLYLDCDIIIEDDVSKLYNINMENKIIAACRDYECLRLSRRDLAFRHYIQETLGVKNVDDYFQAGVLVYNIKELIKNNTYVKLINKLKEIKTPRFVDQDILNSVLYEKVFFIDAEWNFVWYLDHFESLENSIPYKYYKKYMRAKSIPSIIHYAGELKPWKTLEIYYGQNFWHYARKTPIFETLFFSLLKHKDNFRCNNVVSNLEKNISEQQIANVIKNYEIKNNHNNIFSTPKLDTIDKIYFKIFTTQSTIKILKKSYAFDTKYYLSSNIDVAESGMEPLVHYVKYGWKEGRNPNGWFDTNYYLGTYPDVKEKGINPLVHYILYGKKEGRKCTW